MKVHYKWIALLAVVATPLISKAGPITELHGGHNGVDKDEWKAGLPKGWELNGGPKWLNQHDGPGRFDNVLNDFFDRDPHGHHRGQHHDHDRDSNDKGHKGDNGDHTYSGPPGWNHIGDNHIGDRDIINTVPESTSTAMLLGGCLAGLLLLKKTRQAQQPAVSSISSAKGDF
jgi:hypothetical protein